MILKTDITKKDIVIVLVCVIFLVINIGAIGSGGRRRAKRILCLTNLKQLTLAWTDYAVDNDGKLVNGDTGEYPYLHVDETPWVQKDWPTTGSLPLTTKEQAIRDGALFPYCKDIKLYKCPVGVQRELRSYSVVDAMNATGLDGGTMLKHMSEIHKPHDRAVFVDENGVTVMGAWSIHYSRPAWWDEPPVHHGNGGAWSFADGHSEYWKWQDPLTHTYNSTNEMIWKHVYFPSSLDIPRVQRAVWGGLGY